MVTSCHEWQIQKFYTLTHSLSFAFAKELLVLQAIVLQFTFPIFYFSQLIETFLAHFFVGAILFQVLTHINKIGLEMKLLRVEASICLRAIAMKLVFNRKHARPSRI